MAPEKEFFVDIAVVGGGIAGAGVARDAAGRGVRVALFEKNTYASGTSSKSSKLIHGGIRYLELSWNALTQGQFSESLKNLSFVFHALKESRILENTAPNLVKPISLLVPIYKSDRRGPFMVYAGALLYWVLAFFSGRAHFPRFFSKKKLVTTMPQLRSEDLLGGVLIWDHLTDDRALVRAVIASAEKNGAHCFEKTTVTGYLFDESHAAFKINLTSSDVQTVYAKKIVDATGPWIDRTRKMNGETGPDLLHPVAGAHLEVKKFLPLSTLLQAVDGRLFFVVNRGETARIGTTERSWNDPDHVDASEDEIDYLLKSIARYFPNSGIKRSDILSTDAGIRPLPASDKGKSDNAISREHEIHESPTGVFHLVGVKITDHRRAAEMTVDRVLSSLGGKNFKPSKTSNEPL